jgi:hypothetical protein
VTSWNAGPTVQDSPHLRALMSLVVCVIASRNVSVKSTSVLKDMGSLGHCLLESSVSGPKTSIEGIAHPGCGANILCTSATSRGLSLPYTDNTPPSFPTTSPQTAATPVPQCHHLFCASHNTRYTLSRGLYADIRSRHHPTHLSYASIPLCRGPFNRADLINHPM